MNFYYTLMTRLVYTRRGVTWPLYEIVFTRNNNNHLHRQLKSPVISSSPDHRPVSLASHGVTRVTRAATVPHDLAGGVGVLKKLVERNWF